MLAILYHSFYKWEFRGVAPQQGFHSACYRFRHTLKGGTVSLSGNTEWKPCSGATPVNDNLPTLDRSSIAAIARLAA